MTIATWCRKTTLSHQAKLFSACALGALIAGSCNSTASAATCTATSIECAADLDIISSSNIGIGSQGTVTLTELTADSVLVEVSLDKGVKFVNTGGPHTPFTFDLSPTLTGVTVKIDTTSPDKSSTTPQPFNVLSGSQDNTPYGTFTNGIGVAGGNGSGSTVGNNGPLFFTVTDTNGINLLDFVSSTCKSGKDGDDDKDDSCTSVLFAADVLGTKGKTGAVASDPLTCVEGCGTTSGGNSGEAPLPAALPLFASGLGLVGFFGRRKRRKIAS